jgi:RNA polymerase primary sigma factor
MFTWSTAMYGTEAKECGTPNHIQTYFRDLNDVALLSAAEERELAEAIARGDSEARRRMIQANLRLVVRIAKDYLGRGMVLEDLIGEGNLGLIRAAEEYDPKFGTRFSTYASYWIKQAIRHALINTTSTIRLPAHMFGLLNRWRRTERAMCRNLGRTPTFDEVAEAMGLTETQRGLVAKARRASQLKLESSLGDDDGSWSSDETMDPSDAPEAALEQEEERSEILRRLSRLDEREVPLTLKEIGRRLGVTREWVRKIELRAVSRLERESEPGAAPALRPAARRRSRTALPATPFPAALDQNAPQDPVQTPEPARAARPGPVRLALPRVRSGTAIAAAS